MIATFTALLFAHVLADFLVQTNTMVRRKTEFGFFALHIAIVFALSAAALGGAWQTALAIAGLHLIIDAIKTWGLTEARRNTLSAFLTDQGAHVLSIAAVVWVWPDAISTGLWADHVTAALPHVILITGAIVAIFAGGYAVGLLMEPYTAQIDQNKGLAQAGRMIGQLERALIFLFLMVNETAAVGFLIAAKSVLRFDTAAQGQKEGEYVIIGTLASFGWALAVGFATESLLEFAATSP
ncbi:DUF3307 domain-containing protein [Marivita hallyeonensis]|uniref:DUF3307 domain-containing protein n=1 Tax=Marivita hallyeonensis TaxID=996342 RepID=A0A1M5RE08_9RHOB|nr:DUF3307 domain-containing protein [Marivita hallyeonensis]SHH24370.1 Protein of unknown function [Marivita hallyeonensis]